MKWRALILALLIVPACFAATGCNSKANEQEDVAEAQDKVKEEKADLAAED